MTKAERKAQRQRAKALAKPATTELGWQLECIALCSAIANLAKKRWRYRPLLKDVNAELERLGAGFGIGLREP